VLRPRLGAAPVDGGAAVDGRPPLAEQHFFLIRSRIDAAAPVAIRAAAMHRASIILHDEGSGLRQDARGG
jgi:hypothetical protein